jgi:hypothetical protein
MSTFDDLNYRWRETYFVFLRAANRPTVEKLQKNFGRLKTQFELTDVKGDEEGRLESARIIAAAANAAIDINFVEGEEVIEQIKQMRQEMKLTAETPEEKEKLAHIRQCDARLDVLHFQRLDESAFFDEEDQDEMIDPGALLTVLERLAELCRGVGFDPAASSVL